MNFLIAGGTGFIGQNLIDSLPEENKITVVGRDKEKIKKIFAYKVQAHNWQELDTLDAQQFDVIINLSGYNISAARWSAEVKSKIINSRVRTNNTLIQWIIKQKSKPRYYCANAIGIYGLQKNDDPTAFDENTMIDKNHPKDFLQEVGMQWEQSLQPALDYGLPVTITRFGVVLKRGEGILKKLCPSFNLGLGSVIGDGKQTISWIYIEDLILAFRFLFMHHEQIGPFNLASPNPVSQKEFAATLAKVMHKPLFLRTPTWVISLLFGEMGECLINSGTRVLPKRLLEEGFHFSHPNLIDALGREFA